MPTVERVDYPAELERIARAAMARSNPGDVISAMDAMFLRETAQLIRRLQAAAEERGNR